jgi:hypothetical protein
VVGVQREGLGTSLFNKARQTPSLSLEPKNTLRKKNQPLDCRTNASVDEKQKKEVTICLFLFLISKSWQNKKVTRLKKKQDEQASSEEAK